MSARAILLVIFVGLVGCEKGPPTQATLVLERDLIADGGVDFGGVYIGTAPVETVQLRNTGVETMQLTSVSKSGDGAFTIRGTNTDGTFPTEIKGRDIAYVQITFTPTAAKSYAASLTVKTSAVNTPERVISVVGKGVTPPPPVDGGM